MPTGKLSDPLAKAFLLHMVPAQASRLKEFMPSWEEGPAVRMSNFRELQALADKEYQLLGNLKAVWRLVTSWERGEPLDMRLRCRFLFGGRCLVPHSCGDGTRLAICLALVSTAC